MHSTLDLQRQEYALRQRQYGDRNVLDYDQNMFLVNASAEVLDELESLGSVTERQRLINAKLRVYPVDADDGFCSASSSSKPSSGGMAPKPAFSMAATMPSTSRAPGIYSTATRSEAKFTGIYNPAGFFVEGSFDIGGAVGTGHAGDGHLQAGGCNAETRGMDFVDHILQIQLLWIDGNSRTFGREIDTGICHAFQLFNTAFNVGGTVGAGHAGDR